MVGVAAEHERDCYDVVGHHLPVVLATRLGIEDKDLVQVEGALCQIIELERARQGDVGITHPDIHRVQHGRREISVDVLDAQG